MSLFINASTRLIVQGITGKHGSFHTQEMLKYGTMVVGGVTHGRGGEWVHGVPVFDSVKVAMYATDANTSVIFVPPRFATDAIFEAIDAQVPLIVCITEGIPVYDMMRVYAYLQTSNSRLIGPNCPGIITPPNAKVGIIPSEIVRPGNIGIVSKSGALTYEVMQSLFQAGFGVSTCVGVGADPILGTSMVEVLEAFDNDPETEKIVLLGEIGGRAEIRAAEYIQRYMTKPVVGFIAGKTAPNGVRMGHAGAIVEDGDSTAIAKIQALIKAGARIAEQPEHIADMLR
jgi:succinyl-CoA synthetase alpha subunit